MKSNFLFSLFVFSFAFLLSSVGSANSSTTRQYPGGADEQDLRVQPELQEPTLKTDRRTFEQNIMKNVFKKNSSEASAVKKTPPPKKN